MLTGGKDFYDADAAFKKLATLKPSILTYWTSHDQVAQLLNSGQAWIAAWGIDRSITQRMQGAPINCVIPKEGNMKIVSNIGIAKGSAHQALAEKFINLWLSPEIQQSMANNVILAPIIKDVKLTGVVGDAFAPAKLQALDSPDWDRLIPLEPKWAEIWNQVMVK
jgi:putative spermidine/putrescine transport system substrate-binding protein